ncbi:hypothetical protein LTR22_009108 [Elasticomyces elasticus]|nr:hypothetical protein LTR22_009108 [Elasticomyces elasticus]KAK4929249.1 hypothetical protein LTR49_004146 [Elasticomyces elasticus]KAK5765805.1 hypothetical protein LTS12_004065 [Elasticomyces elasticus]
MASKHVDAELDSASEAPFRLMALPDELWSRIARSAVTIDSPIKINSPHYPPGHTAADDKQKLVQPPITRVSRILREEALPAFYTNTFECYEVPYACAFIDWLRSIPSAISCVDDMSIIYATRPWKSMYDFAKRTLEASGFDVVETGDEIVEGYRRYKVVRKG